jgi:hypothetical protein
VYGQVRPHLLADQVRIARAQDFGRTALERLDLPECRLSAPLPVHMNLRRSLALGTDLGRYSA